MEKLTAKEKFELESVFEAIYKRKERNFIDFYKKFTMFLRRLKNRLVLAIR